MAFTFKVEDGTGFTDSNSYVSESEAIDLLFTDTPRHDAFVAADAAVQQAALSLSSTYLDTSYKWLGTKTVEASAMRWPRTNTVDRDGIDIGTNEIPTDLKHAVALMATLVIEGKVSFSESASDDAAYPLKEITVDVIELEFAIPDSAISNPKQKIPDSVKNLLNSFGLWIGTTLQFARINK